MNPNIHIVSNEILSDNWYTLRKIVYDKTYPPSTTDYTPIVRAIAATNPDLVVVCSYPPDTVGIVRANGAPAGKVVVNRLGVRDEILAAVPASTALIIALVVVGRRTMREAAPSPSASVSWSRRIRANSRAIDARDDADKSDRLVRPFFSKPHTKWGPDTRQSQICDLLVTVLFCAAFSLTSLPGSLILGGYLSPHIGAKQLTKST